MRRGLVRFLVIAGLAVSHAAVSHGIVIRHDRPDSSYVELGSRHSSAVSINPDGLGTLVASEWVLTAAHVVSGNIKRKQLEVEYVGRTYAVDRGYVHPGWNGMGPHDIGLLHLSEPVENAQIVDLYSGTDETGQLVIFIGTGDFGTGLTGPTTGPGTRRGATNQIDSVDNDWVFFTFDSTAEATELEGVSGPGDSGGPAFMDQDGTTFVVGVSVASVGDGEPGRYGITEIYSRVSTHRDWLLSVMSGQTNDQGLVVGALNSDSEDAEVRTKGTPVGVSQEIPETPQGRTIKSYLTAYNTGSDTVMAMLIRARYTPEYISEKGRMGHLETYHTLYNTHFGRLTFHETVEQGTDLITFRCQSEKGPIAEITMTITEESRPRIGGLRVAIVSFD